MASRFVSEINVTPFVDVMLVMLIIFMVATPMMSSGLDVDLPQTKQVESLPTESDHMVLTVRRDGALFLDEYRVDNLDQLEGYLKSLVKEKNKTLFLQADKEVPYGIVVDVMGRIKFVGIEKLGVIAENMDAAKAQEAARTAGGAAPAGAPAGGQASK
ncbi:MAG: ExbD/TolR family protein [Desulfovibrio sp.]|nr:ExbD/TolR family protein [Desulfovibrio sp.]